MYKKFDWDICKSNNPIKCNYLKNNYKKVISLEQFMADWIQFRPFTKQKMKSSGLTRISSRLSRSYSPHALKNEYKYFKKKFGFFTGKLQ